MKFAQMVCSRSQNIGDDIQSIAAANRLPTVDSFVDREHLDAVEGPDPTCAIMNAWFLHGRCWPPSANLRPIFVGFHVQGPSQQLVARHAQYLKHYEPIGTRDEGTAEFLTSIGIKAEVTYCLTLTFPTRDKAPANGKVLIVDAHTIDVPRALRRGALRLTNEYFFFPGISAATKLKYAQDLLEFYRDNASLVITTRLHCALPCIAMGIPVVFFGDPEEYRIRIVSDIGSTIYSKRLHERNLIGRTIGRPFDQIDWSPKPLDISPIKDRLLRALATRMETMKG